MTDISFPTQIDHIDAAWLDRALGDRFGRITGVETTRFAEGVGILGELARLRLTYDDNSADPAGPGTIIAKCQSPAPENLFLADVMGFYDREVNFYRHVAHRVDIPVPEAYFVDAGESGLPFVLLLEDIAGAICPDQLAGLTADQADTIIETITPLHLQFWGSDELSALDWLPPMNNPKYQGGQALAEARFPGFAEHFADRIPADYLAAIEKACARYVDLLDLSVGSGTATFTHTDCRAENYLFGGSRGADAVTVVDFQLCTAHVGMWDVANLLGGSLTPELRRASERDLIRGYVDRVRAAGVDLTLDEAEDQYRVCLLHQAAAQVITFDLQGGTDRGTDLLEQLHLRPLLAGAENGAAAVADRL